MEYSHLSNSQGGENKRGGCKSCKINKRGRGNKHGQGAEVVKSLSKIHEEEGGNFLKD